MSNLEHNLTSHIPCYLIDAIFQMRLLYRPDQPRIYIVYKMQLSATIGVCIYTSRTAISTCLIFRAACCFQTTQLMLNQKHCAWKIIEQALAHNLIKRTSNCCNIIKTREHSVNTPWSWANQYNIGSLNTFSP